MTTILDGRPYAAVLKQELVAQSQEIFAGKSVYMAIIFLWNNESSAAYVGFKKKFGEDIGIPVEIFGQDVETKFTHLQGRKQDILDCANDPKGQDKVVELIKFLNTDEACVGMIVQLPLPDPLWANTSKITQHIAPAKDVDAMWGMIYGLDSFWCVDFLGATPQAAMTLLEQYDLANVRGKLVSIVWQSNLTGKPLATHLMKKGATVLSFNSKSSKEDMYRLCKESEYIFACTGVIHLIDENYINDKNNQIIVDIGYGYKDGKPAGDVQLEQIKDKVRAYTPIPGGVWPLTVASLFANVLKLQAIFNK